MIIDSLQNCGKYSAISPEMARAFEFIAQNDISKFADGRYAIDGDDVFMTITTSELRDAASAPIEVHNKYADIQIVLGGRESFGWKSRNLLHSPQGDFDTAKDIALFNDNPTMIFTLDAGHMAVFFPSDGHAPLIGCGKVRKCIVKVSV